MRAIRIIGAVMVIGMVTASSSLHAQTPASRRAPVSRTVKADDRMAEAFKALYSGDPGRALQLTSAYLKEHPSDVKVLVLQARAHVAREEYEAAYDGLVKALALDARNADALYFLAIVASQLSTGAFDRVFALQPDGARVHQLMARSLRLQESPLEAAAEYELALKADPNLVDALLEFAAMDREQSNCDHAVDLYERAQRVQPSYDGAYGLGLCLAVQNNQARAVETFREALKYDPKSAAAEFGLGSSLLQLGDAASAVAALQRAAQLAPNMRETYYVLGRAYQTMGQSERAQEAFARATALARPGATPIRQ
jgi:tetratricopeptide (TPR) repeat protein